MMQPPNDHVLDSNSVEVVDLDRRSLLERPALVLAPHLKYPLRNGSDISLDRIARHLSTSLPYVDLLAENTCVRFREGNELRRDDFPNAHRSRSIAAIRTIALRSHFFLEKFVTRRYALLARRYLTNSEYGTVLCSYITTAHLVHSAQKRTDRQHLIWTHNDEFTWFQDLQRSPNPLVRMASWISEQWLHQFFRHERDAFLFLHVTASDRQGFARYYPDHPSAVIPIGVDLDSSPTPVLDANQDTVRLLFVGSLSVKINLDALSHFAERYDAFLRERLSNALEIVVAGSNPSRAVEALCRSRGWKLHPDVSGSDLSRLFHTATFSILPFPYATGAKLKLLNSLAHGVPFLATGKISAQKDACVYPALIADNPPEWLERIQEVRQHGISEDQRERLRSIARQNSWAASARKIIELLPRPVSIEGA